MKLAVSSVIAALLCLAAPAAASAGEAGLDPSFGSGGVVFSDFGNVEAHAGKLALAPDGTLVVAGSQCSLPSVRGRECDLLLARYTAAGAEIQRTPTGFPLVEDFAGGAMAIDREGRILLGGYDYAGEREPTLVRVTPEGMLDPSISAAAVFSERFDAIKVEAIAVDAAGRILLAGVSGTLPELYVARLLPDGSFDLGFGGGDGIATTGYANSAYHEVSKLVVLPDGGIVLAVNAWGNQAVSTTLRALDADGNPRPDFSPQTQFEHERVISDLVVDSRGRMVAVLAGRDEGVHAARFLADGRLDAAFGRGGVASVTRPGATSYGRRVAVDALDRPVVMGAGFEVVRFTTAGRPDPSLGPNGYAEAPFGKAFTSSALAIDSTGRIVVAGSRIGPRQVRRFVLVRFGAPSCLSTGATILGTPGDDRLLGTPGRDVVLAGAGDDRILTRGGDDLICAGPGSDEVAAGDGDDGAYGQAGDDNLFGQRGDDRLLGGPGRDRLVGGPGRNRMR